MDKCIYESLESYIKSKNDFDLLSVDTLTRNHGYGEHLAISPNTMFSVEKVLHHINAVLTRLESSSDQSDKILESLTRMANDVSMDQCDFCVKFCDTSTIRSIHPGYLNERLNKIPEIIDGIIQNSIGKHDITESIYNKDDIRILKKNLVRTSMSPDIELTDLPVTTSSDIGYDVDRSFLLNIGIPFLKELPEKKLRFRQEFNELENTAENLKNKFSTYSNIINDMSAKGNIDSNILNTLNQFLYNEIKTTHHCFYYMCHMLLVEMTSCLRNIDELKNVLVRLNSHELEDRAYSMTESVMSGTMMDMTIEDVAFPIIEGDVSPMISVLRKLINTHYSGYMMNGKNNDKYIDVNLASASYDNTVYDDTESALNTIFSGLESLEKNMKDRYMSFDDVIAKCGFDARLEDRFSLMLAKIKNINPYTSMENHYHGEKIFLSIMKEFTEAEDSRWHVIGDIICKIHKGINDLRSRLEQNLNDEFPNIEMNREMVSYLFDLDGNVKDLVGDIGCRYLYRYTSLSEFAEKTYDRTGDLITIDINECVDDDTYYDTTDYMEYSQKISLETISLVNSYAMYESNRKYNQAIINAKYGFLMEAEPAQTPQPTNTAQPQQTQTSTPANSNTVGVQQDQSKMSDADVAKNNEAAAQASGNNTNDNSEEKKKTFRDKLKELLTKCQTFFGTVLGKFQKALDVKKIVNVAFLNKNKDAILNRSFNGVVLKIPPYDTYDPKNIFSDINSVNTAITGINASDLGSLVDETAIYAKLLPNINANGKDMAEYLNAHYRFGKDYEKDEKGKYQTVEYKNTALKTLAGTMVAFCEEYTSTGADNLKSEISKLKTTMEGKLNSFTTNTDENTSTEIMSTIGTLSTAVQTITSVMMNAYRDRFNDYMKALRDLVPKRTNTTNTSTSGDAGENPQENTPQPTEQTADQQPAQA